MGIFNDNVHNPHTINTLGTQGPRGERGPSGIGFVLDSNCNFNIQNKKLANVSEGTQNGDAITKHQLDTGLNSKLNTSEASSTADPEVLLQKEFILRIDIMIQP